MNLNFAEDKEFIEHLSKIILDNLDNENFGVSEFIKTTGLNRNYLSKRIKSIKKIKINQFITEVRLEKAREFLLKGTYTASEVSFNVGFSSPSYFTRCFHDFYGYPPSEVKNHITPKRTEKPMSKISEPKPAPKKRWVQMAISAAVFVVVFVIGSEVFFYRPFYKGKDNNENTIAIMPFVNDSGEEFAPFTAWMGIEIGNKLSKIENMLVVPQSTTENYRDSKKSNHDIARELMVDHILRGRTIKTGNKILLNIELLDTKNGRSVFNEIYEREDDKTEEATINRIFEICGDAVIQISEALKTNLTPKEKEQLTKKSTENMAALRAYQEANHHLDLSGINEHSNIRLAYEEFMKAKKMCEDAIKMDSSFADAYTMLGHIYVNRMYFYAGIYLADKYLDTGRIYLNKALLFDSKNISAAECLRTCYLRKGLLDEAHKLLPLTENRVKNYIYYQNRIGEFIDLNDNYHGLEAYFNYTETKPSDMPARDYLTNAAFYYYLNTGFPVRARELNEDILKSVRDTLSYSFRKADWHITYGSKDTALAICYQLHKKDTSRVDYLYYEVLFSNLKGDYAKALDALRIYDQKVRLHGGPYPHVFENGGFTYLKNGMKEKADYHFKGSIKRAEDEIKLNSTDARTFESHFRLALIYAVLNDKQKSIQYLEMIKNTPSVPLNFVNDLKTNPMFDYVRNEPEFQKITSELEKKYLEEHEKIKKLLISRELEPA
jgi:TolB-like protein/AraC-like DNA-binding protein